MLGQGKVDYETNKETKDVSGGFVRHLENYAAHK